MYWINTENLKPELRNTCHYEKINDVAFPQYFLYFFNIFFSGWSDVFATCSMTDIRVWNAKNRQELLRI